MLQLIKDYWLALTIVIAIAILAGSLWPLAELPPLRVDDKIQHIVGYASLSLPVLLKRPRYTLFWVAGIVALGGAIELLQPLVNRHADWQDFVANCGGVVVAAIASQIMRALYRFH